MHASHHQLACNEEAVLRASQRSLLFVFLQHPKEPSSVQIGDCRLQSGWLRSLRVLQMIPASVLCLHATRPACQLYKAGDIDSERATRPGPNYTAIASAAGQEAELEMTSLVG